MRFPPPRRDQLSLNRSCIARLPLLRIHLHHPFPPTQDVPHLELRQRPRRVGTDPPVNSKIENPIRLEGGKGAAKEGREDHFWFGHRKGGG